MNDIIKRVSLRLKNARRPSDLEVSGHSLRVGAAQDLLIKGYDLAAIMRMAAGRIQAPSRGTCGFLNIIFGKASETEFCVYYKQDVDFSYYLNTFGKWDTQTSVCARKIDLTNSNT